MKSKSIVFFSSIHLFLLSVFEYLFSSILLSNYFYFLYLNHLHFAIQLDYYDILAMVVMYTKRKKNIQSNFINDFLTKTEIKTPKSTL